MTDGADSLPAPRRYTYRNHTFLVESIAGYLGPHLKWTAQWWGVDGAMQEYGQLYYECGDNRLIEHIHKIIDALIANKKLIDRGPPECK